MILYVFLAGVALRIPLTSATLGASRRVAWAGILSLAFPRHVPAAPAPPKACPGQPQSGWGLHTAGRSSCLCVMYFPFAENCCVRETTGLWVISIRPRSGGWGGGNVSGQRSQVTGISGKSPLRSKWAWGSMEVLAVGLSSVWPFETSSRKTDGELGRAVTGGPHPPACGERGGGRASPPERWETEACQWSRGQVVSEVAGAARMKWVCGAWPSALADCGISATTVRHRPAALPRGLRGGEVCCVFAPPSSCYFRQRPCSVEAQPALGSHALSFPSLLQQVLS